MAGLEWARRTGKVLGRPKVTKTIEAAVRARLGAGDGILKAARAVGVGTSTAARVKAEMEPRT
jgi:hypothetical protein